MYETKQLSIDETCKKLGYINKSGKPNRTKLYRMRRDGKFLQGKKEGKNVFFLNNEVDIWLILSNDDHSDVNNLPKHLSESVSKERLLEIKAIAEKAKGTHTRKTLLSKKEEKVSYEKQEQEGTMINGKRMCFSRSKTGISEIYWY